jgi:hypothetical protein
MQNSEKDNDEYFINIIQKTPHVERLARRLREEGFPSIDEVSGRCSLHMIFSGHFFVYESP